jgi:hypothetical protein
MQRARDSALLCSFVSGREPLIIGVLLFDHRPRIVVLKHASEARQRLLH